MYSSLSKFYIGSILPTGFELISRAGDAGAPPRGARLRRFRNAHSLHERAGELELSVAFARYLGFGKVMDAESSRV